MSKAVENLSYLRLRDKDALFFDCDGTLIDIADHPDNIQIPADLSTLFNKLSSRCNGAVAIITGRDMDFVDKIFGKVPASASHGAVIRRSFAADVETLVARPDFTCLDDLLNNTSLKREYNIPGEVWVEKKDFARSVHYRNVGNVNEVEPLILQWAEAVISKYNGSDRDNLLLTQGDAALEFGPQGADKGRVLDEFMKSAPFAGRRPVYFGDSLADVPAMKAAQKHGGAAVAIGSAAEHAANYKGEIPAKLRVFLRARLG